MPNGRGPKRVSVMDMGAGEKPFGVIGQAQRALKKRQGRTFEASDIEALPEATFREFGLTEMPKNARIIRGCSIKELKAKPDASVDVVFAGYFFNAIKDAQGKYSSAEMRFQTLKEMHRVLTKNGRGILIVDQGAVPIYRMDSREANLTMHAIPFQERHFEQSMAKFIEARSTRHDRLSIITNWIINGAATREQLIKEANELGLKHIDELAYPIILVMRKKK